MKPSSLTALWLKAYGPQENASSSGRERSTVRVTGIDSNWVLFRIVRVKSLCLKGPQTSCNRVRMKGPEWLQHNIDLQKDIFWSPPYSKRINSHFSVHPGKHCPYARDSFFLCPRVKVDTKEQRLFMEIFWQGWLELINTPVLYFSPYFEFIEQQWTCISKLIFGGKKALDNSLNFYYIKNSIIFYS